MIPPPALVATQVDPSEPFVPVGAKRLHTWAVRREMWARITKAIGPRIDFRGQVVEPECRTIAVAIAAPAKRMIAVWRWAEDKWVVQDEGAQVFPGGATMTMTAAKKLLEESL